MRIREHDIVKRKETSRERERKVWRGAKRETEKRDNRKQGCAETQL